MLGEGLARGAATLEGLNRGRRLRRLLCGDPVLGRRGLEVLELQLELVDEAGAALGALAILLAPQPGDLEPEVLDHRLGGGDDRPGLRQLRFRGRRTRLRAAASAARSRAISEAGSSMARDYHAALAKAQQKQGCTPAHPALAGLCVQRGLRQSMPSRR